MDLLLDLNNDLDLTNNKISFTKNSSDLIRQRLQIKLHMNKGEWKFNILFGLPWMTSGNDLQIIGKNDKSLIDSIIKNEIKATEWVSEILSYNSTLDTQERVYSIKSFVKLKDNVTIEIFEELTL